MNELLQSLQARLGPNAKAIRALMAPLVVVMILAMMVLPLPAFALDLLFTFNIAMALMVMMVAAYMVRPLDFAAFPAVILLTTLLRPRSTSPRPGWCCSRATPAPARPAR